MPSTAEIAICCAVLVSLGAAICDSRSGTIPNVLTLPPLVLAPLLYGAFLGYEQAAKSILGGALSSCLPYLLFRSRAMGGGDVKLFAALGAIAGFAPMTGLRIQWMAFVAALVQGISLLVIRRRFFETLRPMLAMFRLPGVVSARSELARTPIRLGGAVLTATVVQAVPHIAIFGVGP
jgi:prepilin peptidase CpaA